MIRNPYYPKANIYKGQLHCHCSTDGDVATSVSDAVLEYKKAGYDFVCVTAHDAITENPNVQGIYYIPGCEESGTCVPAEGKYQHFGRIGAKSVSDSTDSQTVINSILADGSIACLNHANWGKMSVEDCLALNGYHLFEIRNAAVELPLPGLNDDIHACEVMWDAILSNGMVVWGCAADDTHNYARKEFNSNCVMVYANTPDGILDSLRDGNFYFMENDSSTIIDIQVNGKQLSISVSLPSDFYFIGQGGILLQQNKGVSKASYRITGNEGYIRCRITNIASQKNTWTQPIRID